MAKIVLGLASSHSPNVSTAPDLWKLHADRDRRNPNLDFAALVKAAPAGLAAQLTPDVIERKYAECQQAIDDLDRALAESEADAVVVIGDDQRELFLDECSPAFAIYTGAELVDFPPDPATVDPSHAPAMWSRHASAREAYPVLPDFARALTQTICRDGFDVATVGAQLEARSLGHAFTFVRLRMMTRRQIPMIPVFINCYYPPNQPTPERCFEFGRALRRAIGAAPQDLKVAVVASGGLSHFVIDEALDRQVIDGLVGKRRELLTSLPVDKLNSGNSEIRNWVAAAGAMEDMRAHMLTYVPAYRTEAGTGCGMAFARWDRA